MKTAGPEADEVEAKPSATVAPTPEKPSAIAPDPHAARKVQAIITALGGRKNIQQADAIALTRLRIEVNDSTTVNETALKDAGVDGILRLPNGILHLLVGMNAEQYATEMSGQLTAR